MNHLPSNSDTSWALITGSTSGIGRETAIGLAKDGHAVIVHGRDPARASETRQCIEAAGGRAIVVLADLTDPAAVRDFVSEVQEKVDGPVEILVNNAGGGRFAPTEQTSDEMFDSAFNTHVKAPFILTASFAPPMAERGRGSIVNVGSLGSILASSGVSVFQASKAALDMLTKSWTAEYGPRGVRVNSIGPGFVITPANEAYRDGYGAYLASLPAGRGADPREVAEVIRFVVSPLASYVQGAIITVDGGKTAVVSM